MTDKTITITLTGPDAVITPSLDAFVRQYGWTEQAEETREAKARLIIRQFIMDTVKAYNIDQARTAAATAAQSQTEQAIDLTTLTLTVG